jgi:hypothetical protein
MRRALLLVVVATVLVTGCSLKKDSGNDCTAQPGLTQGDGTVCVKPPPSQFSPMGQ